MLELASDGVRNLARHKLRSFLTALGVIFGVASVLAMIAVGEGAKREILKQIEALGTTNIIINTRTPPPDESSAAAGLFEYGLTFRDAAQMALTLPAVLKALPAHDRAAWITMGARRLPATLRGVTPGYLHALRGRPVIGRLLTDADERDKRRVCVVRESLLRASRYNGDPLRLDLKIGGLFYRVVGVLADEAFNSPGSSVLGVGPDANMVYAPFTSVVDRFGVSKRERIATGWRTTRVELSQILCVVDREAHVFDTAKGVETILASFHTKKDYEVSVPLELLKSRQKAQMVFNITLPIIAGVSLLVGGIGILNIMLASVMERTSEIGVRRAVGATRADIVQMFLMETLMLSILAGVVGLGVGLAAVATLRWATGWSAAITAWSVALSLSVACGAGVVFGVYPARRAAMLEPVAALRHD